MDPSPRAKHLRLLCDLIDPTRVPFSDRGSRLLVYKEADRDRLFVKLAERLIHAQPGLETFLARPPYIHDLAFIDESGQPLPFQLRTYPHALFAETRLGTFGVAFRGEDCLAIGLPREVTAGIRFRVNAQILRKGKSGGSLRAIRDLDYQTNRATTVNEVVPLGEDLQIDCIIKSGEGGTIQITPLREGASPQPMIPFSQTLKSAEERWEAWFSQVPGVEGNYQQMYYYAWWVVANNLVSPLGFLHYEAMMPSKHQYVGIWNWDSCFHALALQHFDIEMARNQLRTMLAWQLPDGMIPDVVFDEGIVDWLDHPVSAKVTKPPVIAWAALKLHASQPNADFLAELYPALVRWNAWWFSKNDSDGDGLVEYVHPYSSGLDDSPLWDHGLPVESPDINTYLSIQMDALATMATTLKLKGEAEYWKHRSKAIVQRMLEDLYDPDMGLFWATHNHEPILELTPFNLYPLWTGQLEPKIVEKLIAHLTNEDAFWGSFPLATVSRSSESYAPETMWRGPVWININYIFIEALERTGHMDLARQLRKRTLSLVAQNDGIYEFYNPEKGSPPERAVPMFGWSAALFIDLVLQRKRRQGES